MPKGPILSTSEVCAHTPGEEELFPQPSSLQAAAQDSIYRRLHRHSAALARGMCARVLLTSPRLTGAKLRGEPPPQSSSWHRPPQSLPSTEAGEGTSQGRQWEEGREGRREEGMFSWAGDTATPAPHVPPRTAPPQPSPPAPSPRNTDTSKKSCWGRGAARADRQLPCS